MNVKSHDKRQQIDKHSVECAVQEFKCGDYDNIAQEVIEPAAVPIPVHIMNSSAHKNFEHSTALASSFTSTKVQRGDIKEFFGHDSGFETASSYSHEDPSEVFSIIRKKIYDSKASSEDYLSVKFA